MERGGSTNRYNG